MSGAVQQPRPVRNAMHAAPAVPWPASGFMRGAQVHCRRQLARMPRTPVRHRMRTVRRISALWLAAAVVAFVCGFISGPRATVGASQAAAAPAAPAESIEQERQAPTAPPWALLPTMEV